MFEFVDTDDMFILAIHFLLISQYANHLKPVAHTQFYSAAYDVGVKSFCICEIKTNEFGS